MAMKKKRKVSKDSVRNVTNEARAETYNVATKAGDEWTRDQLETLHCMFLDDAPFISADEMNSISVLLGRQPESCLLMLDKSARNYVKRRCVREHNEQGPKTRGLYREGLPYTPRDYRMIFWATQPKGLEFSGYVSEVLGPKLFRQGKSLLKEYVRVTELMRKKTLGGYDDIGPLNYSVSAVREHAAKHMKGWDK